MNEPIVAVDIGNSSMRFGLFRGVNMSPRSSPVRCLVLEAAAPNWTRIGQWLTGENPSWTVSSVHRGAVRDLSRWLAKYRSHESVRVLRRDHISIRCDVEQPGQLGMDRIMAAVAANALRDPQRPAIIVDAGSVITVDSVDSHGVFLGGAILPGLSMAATALHQQTDQLPLIDCNDYQHGSDEQPNEGEFDASANASACSGRYPEPIGRSTEKAIASGLMWGAIGAVESLINLAAEQLSDPPCLFFTGGNARLFETHFGTRCRVEPNLVMLGIALTAAELGDV